MSAPSATYKPLPGSAASRVVELMRFLPRGTALPAGDLRQRLDISARGSLHIHLIDVTRHGLLRAEKREEGGKLRTYWMDGRGVDVWAESSNP
jgi:hypothetical protein